MATVLDFGLARQVGAVFVVCLNEDPRDTSTASSSGCREVGANSSWQMS